MHEWNYLALKKEDTPMTKRYLNLLRLLSVQVLLSLSGASYAQTVTAEGTITAVDTQNRTISVTRQTATGEKTGSFSVSPDAKILLNGTAAQLQALAPSHKVTLAFDTTLGSITSIEASSEAREWIELFDGRTLDGWTVYGKGGTFEAKDGMIIGTSVFKEKDTHTCLCKGPFADFVLEFEVMCDRELNSGVFIRSHVYERDTRVRSHPVKFAKKGTVYGYQCEIIPAKDFSGRFNCPFRSDGMPYRQNRWGFFENDTENRNAHGVPLGDGWNHYRIAAQGSHIRSWVNGIPCADFHDNTDASGLIAFQVFDGVSHRVRFKNIRLRELKPGERVE